MREQRLLYVGVMMAMDKLFQVLVLGGVSMGLQACTAKKQSVKVATEEVKEGEGVPSTSTID
jgi:hypothetical protein